MPLMSWQQQVADTALELRDDGTLAYRDVVVHVPRQQGKSRLLLVVMLARALAEPRQGIRYSAQSGVMARSKLVDDWLPELQQSPIGSMFTTRLVNGHEALRFSNGSRIELVATTRKSGHGLVIDLAVIDEAFALADSRLEQALKPAMVTRPSPQLWVVSTAGTPEESPYLWSKVEAGRQLAGAGLDVGVAYFEWSAPEDADPADREAWYSCMPALGHTIDESAIEADLASMPLPDFQRAYLNQWRAPASDPVIPLERWRELADPYSESPVPQVLAIDASPEGTTDTAAIAAAAQRDDGRIHVGVLEHGPGRGWVVERMAELFREHSRRKVLVDARGPARELVDDLEHAGVRRIVVTSAGEMTMACEGFLRAVNEGRIAHRGTAELTAAIDGARKRTLGDSWAWKRRGSSSDITPLVGATLAHFGCRNESARRYVWSWREAFYGPEDADATELEHVEDPFDPARLAAVMRRRGFDEATIERVLVDKEEG
jgi:phage terminase large subunit-like protein